MADEKIFSQYGFDIGISVKDSFTLTALGGILLLQITKQNGDEITSRRQVVNEEGDTRAFNVNQLTVKEKKDFIDRLLKLNTPQTEIAKLLGLSSSYISNLKRT